MMGFRLFHCPLLLAQLSLCGKLKCNDGVAEPWPDQARDLGHKTFLSAALRGGTLVLLS